MTHARNALLTNEMGLGKSASTIKSLDAIGDSAFPAVVVCPNGVKYSWKSEIERWSDIATPYVLDGTASKRRKILTAAAEDPSAVVIVNIEGVRLFSRLAPYGSVRLKRCPECGGDDEPAVKETACETHERELNQIPFRTGVLDEGHRAKDPRAKQTRAVWALFHASTMQQRFALTGTPIANHVGDLWSVMHAIAPNEYPTRSKFMDRYAMLSWNAWGGMDVIGLRPDTRDELFKFLDPRFRRVLKSQVLSDLPPKVRSIRHAPMLPKMRTAYRELEQTLVTRLDDGSILFAPNSLTSAVRLLQLSSSYGLVEVLGEDPETGQQQTRYHLTDQSPHRSPKLDVMEEIIDEMGDRPIAVCALSRQLIDLAAARLDTAGISYGLITGAITGADRDRALSDFQAGRLRVLLFTIQAGGVGLTMTTADTLVFLQRSWSMIDNRQAEDRVHRIGSEQHESVHIIDVVAPETIEERQIERVHEKMRRLAEITRDELEDDTINDLREDL